MVALNGIKFGKKGIKDPAGNYYPCFYSFGVNVRGENGLTIYARDIIKGLPKALNPRNNSDSMTDYFESDRARFPAGSEIYNTVKELLQ